MDSILDFRFLNSTAESIEVYGSWDNYAHGFALTADKKKLSWNGTVKVRLSAIQSGRAFLQRYWYYYMLDGIEISYDENKPHMTELKTGRVLNVYDIELPKTSAFNSSNSSHIAKGSPLLSSQIEMPTPMSSCPKLIGCIGLLDDGLKQPKEESQEDGISSESCSDESTRHQCTCERYGITRAADRVKLDCGGTKCGLCDDDSSFESGQDNV